MHLLPIEFTLSELKHIFEIIIGNTMEKKSFRRRIDDADILETTGNTRKGSNRPAKLYRVKADAHEHYYNRNMTGQR